ncbi:type III secretion system inner membrane ring lipoprotein SctJ [Qipengyuania sp. DGS5-3]|uniref:type III secretion system inner membrane ring lipoprotein SctJ n=1 Tax=Qipengyuania sp. DGS5-3 TaxID=3349632 RepID=UPI0036D282CB
MTKLIVRLRAAFLTLGLAGVLAACSGQELYRDIDEREANEMVASLTRAGIESEKTGGEKGMYTVSVGQADFARSVEVLRQNGLPREQYESLGSVFKKEGFTSSSLAERARLVYGLSQELSHTISEFDGVVEARVHLALPEADALTGAANPPSASVFVKYQEGFDLRSQTAAIKSLVMNSIEGLEYDRVSIAMTEAKPPPTPAVDTSFDQVTKVLTILIGVLGAALLVLGAWRVFTTRRKRQAGTELARTEG